MSRPTIKSLLEERILILDGAMGTSIQGYNLEEKDFRGNKFLSINKAQKGNNDLLSLTQPAIISEIHASFLEAGADIIETNTFNATCISQKDYGLENEVYTMNLEAAKLAKEVADQFTASTPSKPRFVAGSIGPTNKTASLSPDVENPAYRNVTFDELVKAYHEQILGLLEGGVDCLLIETIFDTLNARAALIAADEVFVKKERALPIMLSVTLTDKSGRTLSGQDLEAFVASMSHPHVISLGLNCAFGGQHLMPFVRKLAKIQDKFVSVYPNAGLPNLLGEYDEDPEKTANVILTLATEGCLNIVGGCCGTTPQHIKKIAEAVQNITPRRIIPSGPQSKYCGLEVVQQTGNMPFLIIGERTNVSGSFEFAHLIRDKKYEQALSIAKEEIENGAQIIDINFDDALLDSEKEMIHFLRLLTSEPDIIQKAIMIDSSKWEVLLAGLKNIQGKPIVNSISLKNGEELFLQQAKIIKSFGAAVVVMAFDEKGQAATYKRKIEICERAYYLLVNKLNFPPEDIIFDPSVLTIATGLVEHNQYAVDFIEATRWIKKNLPYAKVLGGVSNLSFSFRGQTQLREIMHSVFLHHAKLAGLDMALVNPSTQMAYEKIPKDLLELVEDVVLNRDKDATNRLLAEVEKFKNNPQKESHKPVNWRKLTIEERLKIALIKGETSYLKEDLYEAKEKYVDSLQIIEGPLMQGMSAVGDSFAKGEMFLPQIIKSARVMKKAVEILMPFIQRDNELEQHTYAGKILLATVKGDVHDIGKNIVAVVLGCNHFEVIDLGVMTPCETIIETAIKEKVDMIGLSGLITPSLEEMIQVAKAMEKAGLQIPLIIGGATTSRLHTALKIAPHYSGAVVYGYDASKTAEIAKKLLSTEKETFLQEIQLEDRRCCEAYLKTSLPLVSLETARKKAFKVNFDEMQMLPPKQYGVQEVWITYEELEPYIDWTYFFSAWNMKKPYPDILENEKYAKEAKKLYQDAQIYLKQLNKAVPNLLKGVIGLFKANTVGDTIIFYNENEQELLRLPVLRQQQQKKDDCYYSLADFIAPKISGQIDYIGSFFVTAGLWAAPYIESLKQQGDDYGAIITRLLCDRLAEAFAEKLHKDVRQIYWGYEVPSDILENSTWFLKSNYEGIRPAFGYPSLNDQSQMKKIFSLLEIEKRTGATLTENNMIDPVSSICGLYFARKEARYFDITKIGTDQLLDYADRTGEELSNVERRLNQRGE